MTDRFTPPPVDVLTPGGFFWRNRYRIGDAVALLTLQQLVQDRRRLLGHDPAAMASTAFALLNNLQTWVGVAEAWPVIGPAEAQAAAMNDPERFTALDDVNLWVWNDLFHRHGVRLPVAARPAGTDTGVVVAPLVDVEYAYERAWHPVFVEDVVQIAADLGDRVSVILPPGSPLATVELVRSIASAYGAVVTSAGLADVVALIRSARLFVGGDTGLSHIAGLFDDVPQVAIHDRANLERHNAGHHWTTRERLAPLAVALGFNVFDPPALYRSFPNKPGVGEVLFDRHGWDDSSITATRVAIHTAYHGKT